VHDAIALSKAGLAKLSSALTLIDGLKGETECKSDPEISLNPRLNICIWASDVS
jgi:aminopeptidase 2